MPTSGVHGLVTDPRVPQSALAACESCDLLQRSRPIGAGEKARCSRCGGVLYRGSRNSLERTLALTLASLALFAVANAYPFMSFALEGRVQENYLITGVLELYAGGDRALAAVIFLTTILAPLLEILATLYIVLPLHAGRVPPGLAGFMRFQEAIGPWAMLEVYMLGVIVAVSKLAGMATIGFGPGAFAFVALFVVLTASAAAFDPQVVWQRLEARP
jgi:paraquat-inducible protein A